METVAFVPLTVSSNLTTVLLKIKKMAPLLCYVMVVIIFRSSTALVFLGGERNEAGL